MGLLKETMKAIIRIDQNLNAIRKVLANGNDDRLYRAEHQQKSIEQVYSDWNRKVDSELSLFDRLPQLEIFPYPSNLTLGGRFTAVRKFHRLNQNDIATALDVTPSYVSRIEADKVMPSATIIRFFALTYNINEGWLATGVYNGRYDAAAKLKAMMVFGSPGELPQTSEEREETAYRDMPKIIYTDNGPNGLRHTVQPLSGCEKKLTVEESMNRVHQARIEVQTRMEAQVDSR